MDSGSSSSNEKCDKCDRNESSQEKNSSNEEMGQILKDIKKNPIIKSFTNLRRSRSKRSHKKSNQNEEMIKKSPKWNIKFTNKKESKLLPTNDDNSDCCKCNCYKKTDDDSLSNNEASTSKATNTCVEMSSSDSSISSSNLPSSSSSSIVSCGNIVVSDGIGLRYPLRIVREANDDFLINNHLLNDENNVPSFVGFRGIYAMTDTILISSQMLDMQVVRALHDCDEEARLKRAREIEEGIEPPANYRPSRRVQLLCSNDLDNVDNGNCSNINDVGNNNNNNNNTNSNNNNNNNQQLPRRLQLVCPSDLSVDSIRSLFQNNVTLRAGPLDTFTGCHTQVDFIHCLVPDLLEITKCSFYWGKMDRYEAERLLDGKPEGTFLLRDSAQEEFLFSVSFRKYGRSLHARIEQWNHKFSFDSHDPGVYTSNTVCGLIEHYKDPSSCMFFEPILTWPLHRNFTFSLQHLSRSVIVNRLTYDNINHLQLPKTLKNYLKEYHYRQKVRVESFDDEETQWFEIGGFMQLRNIKYVCMNPPLEII